MVIEYEPFNRALLDVEELGQIMEEYSNDIEYGRRVRDRKYERRMSLEYNSAVERFDRILINDVVRYCRIIKRD